MDKEGNQMIRNTQQVITLLESIVDLNEVEGEAYDLLINTWFGSNNLVQRAMQVATIYGLMYSLQARLDDLMTERDEIQLNEELSKY